MNHKGLLTCANYASPPNSLHYCGPEKQTDLADYQRAAVSDNGLGEILQDFQTLYPYLALIAYENNLRDPFDPRVVEAYWIGNYLLSQVSMNKFYQHLSDSLALKKQLKRKDLEWLVGKIPHGALPHHAFHVLNVFTRTGHQRVEHTLETMDACRIGWGTIIQISKLKSQNVLSVETEPLILQNGKLSLGKPVIKQIRIPFIHKSKFINPDQIGVNLKSIVSFHWNTFCDILSDRQVKSLERYTRQAIRLANTTL